jgi:hypothetical protein
MDCVVPGGYGASGHGLAGRPMSLLSGCAVGPVRCLFAYFWSDRIICLQKIYTSLVVSVNEVLKFRDLMRPFANADGAAARSFFKAAAVKKGGNALMYCRLFRTNTFAAATVSRKSDFDLNCPAWKKLLSSRCRFFWC